MIHNFLPVLKGARPRGRWVTAASLAFCVVGALGFWRNPGDLYGLVLLDLCANELEEALLE